MKIVVVGNGSTAYDAAGAAHINRHTADFLVEIAGRFGQVTWVEPRSNLVRNANLQDAAVDPALVESLSLAKSLGGLGVGIATLIRLLSASFVYIFFPGTLPRLIVRCCILLGKPYGLYLRGQNFCTTGTDADIIKRAKRIISVSPGLSKGLESLNPNIEIIRPMLDLGLDNAVIKDLAGRTSRPWRLLFVGRLEPAKGVAELIEAAQMLTTEGFGFELRLAGGGPLHEDLVSTLPADGPVRLLGQVHDKGALMSLYEWADIFVLPTHHEGFPRVLYEAMMKSNVVLTTFVGGIPGVMRDGENCVQLPLRSAQGIADAVMSVTCDPQRMQRLSIEGHATVRSILSDRPSHIDAFAGAVA